jgi:hypothetical protein
MRQCVFLHPCLMEILKSLADFLSIRDAPASCDLIFVLAGRPERKPYGWQLFQSDLAPRLIFSVGRYEARQAARQPVEIPGLMELREKTPPPQRHFWADFKHGSVSVSLAGLVRTNTYWELRALGRYLEPDVPQSIAIVSTSIHLRRVRFCCRRIPSLKSATLLFLPVPEDQSSFTRNGWWKHADQFTFLLSEYAKLAGYYLLYGWR